MVAGSDSADGRADPFDDAGTLVPQDDGARSPGHLLDGEIGVTDPRRDQADQDLVGPWIAQVDVLDHEPRAVRHARPLPGSSSS